jgi:hypothetical protein
LNLKNVENSEHAVYDMIGCACRGVHIIIIIIIIIIYSCYDYLLGECMVELFLVETSCSLIMISLPKKAIVFKTCITVITYHIR